MQPGPEELCLCSSHFGRQLSAGGGWVLEGFVAYVQLRASPVRMVLFVLSTGLTWGRLTDRAVV